MKRYYVGHKAGQWLQMTVVLIDGEPSEQKTPHFSAVTGPFRTRRAAEWMVRCGYGCHFDSIAEAERLALLDDVGVRQAPG